MASIVYVVQRQTSDGEWIDLVDSDEDSHLRDALAVMHREFDLTRAPHRIEAREIIATTAGMPPVY
ncbi:hypothetical protein [Streptomyces sp. ISBFB 2968]|uniref:hypothetical protein n=1 Tax=Streptomyces sp. ISBFB 2968 TaxID=2903527 RepID=UPI002FDC2038